jgi:hypothetical protein
MSPLRESFDFDESDASQAEERGQVRALPMLFGVFVMGMLAGVLLVLCCH